MKKINLKFALVSLICIIVFYYLFSYNKQIEQIQQISYNTDNKVEVKSIKYLYGPNMWNYHPSIEVLLDIKEFEKYPSNNIPHIYDSLKTILPSLYYHRCSKNRLGGFFERLNEGTYFGHIVEHIALELQNLTDCYGGKGRTRDVEDNGLYKIVLSSNTCDIDIILKCFHCAIDLLLKVIDKKPVSLYTYKKIIKHNTSYERIGSNLFEIIKSLKFYKIPYIKPIDNGSFIQLGYGKTQQRLWITTTGKTEGIVKSISSNIKFSRKLLSEQGIIVPESYEADNLKETIEYINDIGYPVIIKFNDNKNQIIKDTNDEKNLKSILGKDTDVIIEKYIVGDYYRVTMVNFQVIAICKKLEKTLSVNIIGNGHLSLEELIENYKIHLLLENNYQTSINNSSDLIIYTDNYFKQDKLDEFLKASKQDKNEILEKNKIITVELTYKYYQDIDVDKVSANILSQCILANKIINLDVCGIDLIAKNIYGKNTDGEFSILKLNASPDLRIHKNSKNKVSDAIISYLFPHIKSGEKFDTNLFPIFGITGNGNRKYVNKFLSTYFTKQGKMIGSVGEAGCFIQNKKLDSENEFHKNVKKILTNVSLDMGIFDNSSDIIDNEGLSYYYCNAIILGNINKQPDNIRLIKEPANTFRLIRTQFDIIGKGGFAILNADDPNIGDFNEINDTKVEIIYYSMFPNTNFKYNKIVYYDNSSKSIYASYKNNEKKIIQFDKQNLYNLPEICASVAGIWTQENIFNANIDFDIINQEASLL